MNTALATILIGGLLFPFLASGALPGDWQVRGTPTNRNLNAITIGAQGLVAAGQNRTILRSEDGVHWSLAQHALPAGDFFAIAYGAGMYVAGGESNAVLAMSVDGITWTNFYGAAAGEKIYGLTFAEGLFVGVGTGSGGEVSNITTSPDGQTWHYPSSGTPNTLRAVAHGGNRFVAVGDLGMIVTSTNGSIWSAVPSGTMNTLRAVTYSGTRFIAAGDVGTVVTSIDGISWAIAAPASFAVHGLAASPEAVVAVGRIGSSGRLHASVDGMAWPGNSTDFPQTLNGIVRVGAHRFIVVGTVA